MFTIQVFAPYQSFADTFRQVFAETQKEDRADAADRRVRLEIVADYDHEVLRPIRPDCDVVIARGRSAAVLKQRAEAPVVEVPILPYDMVRVWKKCRETHPGKQVVFPATPLFCLHMESLDRLLDLGIQFIHLPAVTRRDLEAAFGEIRDMANSVVMGGKPATELAEEKGIPNFTIESSPEAMRTALTEAVRLASIRRREQERTQHFKSILDYNSDGILALDNEDRFTALNAMAEKILELAADAALGKTLAHFAPNEPLVTLLARTPHCSDEVVLYKTVPLVVNKKGVFLEGERIGSMVTVQYLSRIQNSEKNIRNKIADRGLVAKHTFDDIKGGGEAIRLAVNTARKFGTVDSGVLIIGQSGTGKELFAQSIHSASPQKHHPFMAINCAAIPENLLESELFGYVEGAFTGAVKGGKPGLIELAHMGTLFLDEIGEMPLRLQARLLRVLQEKEIMRVGSEKITPVAIRVIAATNKNLPDLIGAGQFREDLYYRLAVLTLRLPTLEERREDIPQLVRLFVTGAAERLRRPVPDIDMETMGLLCRLPWPGNVRELRNICEQLVVLCEEDAIRHDNAVVILSEKIRLADSGDGKDGPVQPVALGECTPELIDAMLAEGHSKRRIAELLGINRSTLWRRMHKGK